MPSITLRIKGQQRHGLNKTGSVTAFGSSNRPHGSVFNLVTKTTREYMKSTGPDKYYFSTC
jgi:hypothetical protein